MKKLFRPTVVVNIFGAVGYMLLVAAWAFLVAITIAVLLDASIISTGSTTIVQDSTAPSTNEPSPVLIIASYAITGVVALLSLAIVVVLPYLIGKWGSRLLRRLMMLLKVDIASMRQLFLAKCIIATLPLVGFMAMYLVLTPDSLAFAAMHIATVTLSALSLGSFLAQFLIARHLNVSVDNAW